MDDNDAGSIARRGWAALLEVLNAKGVITGEEKLRILSEAYGLKQPSKVTPLRLVRNNGEGAGTDPPDPDPAA